MTAAIACPTTDQLRQFIDGTLPESEQAALTAHVETCEGCQKSMESLVAGRETWEGAAKQLAGSASTADPALKNVIDELRHDPHAATHVGAGDELPPGFLSPPDDPTHLGKLHHYEIIETVGHGAFGIVLRAFDQKLHRVVAIKVMLPHLATNATARKRFIREGQAAAAVCHEHVVTIHAVEEANNLPYLVMQFISGKSLQDRIDQSGPLQVKEILRIGLQAADGLSAAHAQGLVHRDIKPANILLENGVERVKITDFGLARAVDDASLTQSGVIAGTPQYMAPEQARGESIDHRADLFSLGCVLYTMAAGRAPFRGSSTLAVMKRVCEDTPRPIREMNPDIPDWLAAIIDKLMAKSQADRFQTAREVSDLLGQHLAHLQQPALVQKPAAIQPVPVVSREDATVRAKGRDSADRDVSIEAVLRQVKGPSLGLVITGLLNWLGLLASSFVLFYLISMQGNAGWIPAVLILLLVVFFGSWIILWGAFRMQRLESYGWAVTSAVGALLIGPAYIIGWPVGLWSLFVLTRPEVRQAFRCVSEQSALGTQTAARLPGTILGLGPLDFGKRTTLLLRVGVMAGLLVVVGSAWWFLNRQITPFAHPPTASIPTGHLRIELADPGLPFDVRLWKKEAGRGDTDLKLTVNPDDRVALDKWVSIGDYRVVATLDDRLWFNTRFYLEPGGRKTIVVPGPSKDYDRLKGRWLVSLHEANGARVPNELRVLKLVFDGKSVVQITADDPQFVPRPTQFVVDDRQKPAHFDAYNADGKHIETGIYEYQPDSDFLKLCKGPTTGPRPTEFKTAPQSDYVLFVCTREGPRPTKPDEELLQGRWTALSGDMNGEPMPGSMLKQFWVEFAGETMHVPTQPGKVGKGTFTLNTAKSPREIVVIRESENNRGTRGIYELKDGTLRLCMGEPEDWPISEFRSRPGTKIINLVLKRSPPQATAEDENPAVIPEDKSPPPKVAANDVEGLQRLVTLAQQDFDRIRMLVERGFASQTELTNAEINLKNAQLRLAVAKKDDPSIIRLLKELVKLRELDLDRMKKLQVRGVVPPSEVNDSERALIEAQLRLKQA